MDAQADNGNVMSLQVSGEYVVIGYFDGTVRCLQLKKRGRRRGCTRRTRHGDVIAVSGEYVVIGYEDGTVRCLAEETGGGGVDAQGGQR